MPKCWYGSRVGYTTAGRTEVYVYVTGSAKVALEWEDNG